jgi:hypothetical protein
MEPTTPIRPTITIAPEPITPEIRSQVPKCPPAPRKVRRVISIDHTNSPARRSLLSRLVEAGYICPNAPFRPVQNENEKVETDDIAKVLF